MIDRTCQTCRYWSEMVASFTTDLEAACLSGDGPHAGKMTPRWHSCPCWADGVLGAIDMPGVDPEALLTKYAELDGAAS